MSRWSVGRLAKSHLGFCTQVAKCHIICEGFYFLEKNLTLTVLSSTLSTSTRNRHLSAQTQPETHIKVKEEKFLFLQITGRIVNGFSRPWPEKDFCQTLAARDASQILRIKNKKKTHPFFVFYFFCLSSLSVKTSLSLSLCCLCVEGRNKTKIWFWRQVNMKNTVKRMP